MVTKGQKINDRYEIISNIGEGGMANVYLAHDTILDRKVAIKILRGDLASDEKFVRRFQREALSASSLSHPNIVEMYDVGEDNGEYYIVMEYIKGKTLKQLLKKRSFLTVPEVIDIMLQLTDGLAQAHDLYIIHRDIKPQNILILENGLVKITDFGIAMALNASNLTQTNSVMGSVHYLSPEQASGKGSTIKSDIYSLGIIMYELLTGKLPFKGENAIEIALKQLKDQMPNIRKQISDIPQSIENIILKATAKNPKNRYNSVREMHEDLKTALNEDKINEPRHVYKYLEHELEDTKKLPVINNEKDEEKEEVKEIASKQIAGDNMEKNNKWVIIFGGLFLTLLTFFALLFLILPYFTNVPDVKIPVVSNFSIVDLLISN
jgi:serine/threonine-protein kinase